MPAASDPIISSATPAAPQLLTPGQIKEWKQQLHEEANSAYIYRKLAEREHDDSQRDILNGLAEIEDRHVTIWRDLLAQRGVQVGEVRPSKLSRFAAKVTRLLPTDVLLHFMLNREAMEVKHYLQLSRTSQPGALQDAATTLARESAEHAQTLTRITGGEDEPWHQAKSGGIIRSVIYGFNDGLTANAGLVAGVIGASVDPHIILLTGTAGMIADALSMGSSGYLAAKSEVEVYQHEIEMERREHEFMPEVEQEELALMYQARGIDKQMAEDIARDLMQHPERALHAAVVNELGIVESHTTPVVEGIITAIATAIGALIPIAPFFFLRGIPALVTSFIIAMGAHFVVGAARSFFTGRGLLRSGFDMFIVGLSVAVLSYFIGDGIMRLLM